MRGRVTGCRRRFCRQRRYGGTLGKSGASPEQECGGGQYDFSHLGAFGRRRKPARGFNRSLGESYIRGCILATLTLQVLRSD
jgi:hypothetical protein